MYLAEVRLMTALISFDHPYTYLSDFPLKRGDIVALPFGKSERRQYAVVTALKDAVEDVSGIKKILFKLEEPYTLGERELGVAEYMSEQFFAPFGECARLMLPTGLDISTAQYLEKGEAFSLLEDDNTDVGRFLKNLFSKTDKPYIEKSFDKKLIRGYIKKGIVTHHTEAVLHVSEKKERYLKIKDTASLDEKLKGSKNKEKYKNVVSYLEGVAEAPFKTLREIYSIDQASLSFLEKRGLVEVFYKSVERTPYNIAPPTQESTPILLSNEQKKAYETLEKMLDDTDAKAGLLYGVTGSGKTSVIMKLIDRAIEEGRGVIMLVPEIALTSQSAEALFSRYFDKVAVIHSGMSKGERHDAWASIRSGKKKIVLGTRSAIFAPVQNLGLVVIDEEQDDSYKSDTSPRYHARDVARFVCAKSSALMLLSSATPDVESYYNALSGKYTLVTLKERYGKAELPDVCISDVLSDPEASPERLIGSCLRERLEKTLERGEQAILFVNRRGLKKVLTCRDCHSAVTCPNCSVSLTLHEERGEYKMVCHYCGYTTSPPLKCPTCSSEHMQYRGYGTQKLEEELKKLFPEAKTIRMDADTTRQKLSHDEIIDSFSRHEADFLIGTQMVTKGHNFPDVTLVGVIMADLSLYSSDYRANEHTFSLMTQVVGRAGRGKKKGSAIIQTMDPYNEIIELCTTQNYDEFYSGEIELRRALIFPPFCSVGMFLISSDEESELDNYCTELGNFFTKKLAGEFSGVKIIAYGPFDAVPYKLKNTYRRKLVVKFKNNRETRALFKEALLEFSKKGKVTCIFDPSPSVI